MKLYQFVNDPVVERIFGSIGIPSSGGFLAASWFLNLQNWVAISGIILSVLSSIFVVLKCYYMIKNKGT